MLRELEWNSTSDEEQVGEGEKHGIVNHSPKFTPCCFYTWSETRNLSESPVQDVRTSPQAVSSGSGSDRAVLRCTLVFLHALFIKLHGRGFALVMNIGAKVLLVLRYLILMEADILAAGSVLPNISTAASCDDITIGHLGKTSCWGIWLGAKHGLIKTSSSFGPRVGLGGLQVRL